MATPKLPTPQRAAEIRKLAALAGPGAPTRLLTCRCGLIYVVQGEAADGWVEGCPYCGRAPDWPYAAGLAKRILRLTIKSAPDEQGRQRFTMDWIEPDTGRVRGQCFHAVVADQTRRPGLDAHTLLIVVPFPDAKAVL